MQCREAANPRCFSSLSQAKGRTPVVEETLGAFPAYLSTQSNCTLSKSTVCLLINFCMVSSIVHHLSLILHSKYTGMFISLLLLGMLFEHLHISFKLYWNGHFTILVGHAFGASASEYTKKLHIDHYSTYLIIHFKLKNLPRPKQKFLFHTIS